MLYRSLTTNTILIIISCFGIQKRGRRLDVLALETIKAMMVGKCGE